MIPGRRPSLCGRRRVADRGLWGREFCGQYLGYGREERVDWWKVSSGDCQASGSGGAGSPKRHIDLCAFNAGRVETWLHTGDYRSPEMRVIVVFFRSIPL